jgi:hypothetical protein
LEGKKFVPAVDGAMEESTEREAIQDASDDSLN